MLGSYLWICQGTSPYSNTLGQKPNRQHNGPFHSHGSHVCDKTQLADIHSLGLIGLQDPDVWQSMNDSCASYSWPSAHPLLNFESPVCSSVNRQ